MRKSAFRILENVPLTPAVSRLILAGDTGEITTPGQFVSVRLDSRFLRRPFSVCDREDGRLTVVYKAVGGGTEFLRTLEQGSALELLTGLGRGFDLSRAGERPLLLGGGVGLTPLYWLAKELRKEGRAVTAVLGFASRDEAFYVEEFQALGCAVTVTTADGSRGVRGFVTDALPEAYSFVYACGPEGMLRAVCERTEGPGQLSLEARMGCGFGACMGCTRQTVNGPKRVCKEGPVFDKEELLWPTQE